jgi:hypothetical protein
VCGISQRLEQRPRSGRGDCGYALGVHGEIVEDMSDLKTALSRAIKMHQQ